MVFGIDVYFIFVRFDVLCLIQMMVGYCEVKVKCKYWKVLNKCVCKVVIELYWFLVVFGLDGLYYIIDYYYLGFVLIEEGELCVNVMLLKDLLWFDDMIFWWMMEYNQWVYLFGLDGLWCDYVYLLKVLMGFEDDLYCSFVGELCMVGGYVKDVMLFSEFLWVDYLCQYVLFDQICKNFVKVFDVVLYCVYDQDVCYLFGWLGVIVVKF